MERQRWSSRSTFILGAVGSTVGLGNFWRFPFLALDHEGSTFLVPYILSLIFIGIPVLFLEIALGRKFQGGIPYCMSFIHPRLVGIGWMSIFGTAIVTTYYSVLIARTLIFFFNSFDSPLPWGLLNGSGIDRLSNARKFFENDVLEDSGSPAIQETVNLWLLDALILVWFVVYLAIYKGVTFVSKVVIYSVSIPIVLLWILLFSNVNRPGANEAVQEYLGNFDLSILFELDVWMDSVTQVFFSIGLGYGTMTAYSSFLESKKGILGDTLRIAFLDTFVSYFSGFTVFAIVGALANEVDVNFTDDVLIRDFSRDSLAYIAFPAGIAAIGDTPVSQIFSAIFFLTLFLLGIDSQFSMVEAVITGIRDSETFKMHRHEFVALILCVILFIFSIFFALDNGRYVLDIIDETVNDYVMLGVGALESVAATWIYGLDESISVHGFKSIFAFNAIYLLGVLLLPVLTRTNGWTIVFIWWFGSFMVAFGAALRLDTSPTSTRYDLFFSGGASKLIRSLAIDEYDELSKVPRWYTILLHIWMVLLKYLIPPVLYMLMVFSAETQYVRSGDSDSDEVRGDGSDLIENVGKFIVIFGWCVFLVFLLVDIETYNEMTTGNQEEREELLLERTKQSSNLVKQ